MNRETLYIWPFLKYSQERNMSLNITSTINSTQTHRKKGHKVGFLPN